MANTAEDVEAALTNAARGESESSTDSKTTETPTSAAKSADSGTTDSKGVPYERFKEVNDALNAAKETHAAEIAELKSSLQTAQKTAHDLTEVVAAGQEDARLVAALKGLANNPKYSDLIDRVDNALQGIDDAVDSGEVTKEEGKEVKSDIIQEVRNELLSELAEQKSEILLQRADMMAKEYISDLPAEFTEQDREIVQELWANRLDWSKVEQNPDQMGSILKESFESALKSYGDPKGKVAASSTETNDTPEVKPEPTVEETMGSYLQRNYGAIKDGKPEFSDQDFQDDFSKAFKLLNQQKG